MIETQRSLARSSMEAVRILSAAAALGVRKRVSDETDLFGPRLLQYHHGSNHAPILDMVVSLHQHRQLRVAPQRGFRARCYWVRIQRGLRIATADVQVQRARPIH